MATEEIVERRATEPGQIVMPFYVICDVSGSMGGDMADLNTGLDRLRKAILREPIVDDVARVSVISFSDSASTVLALDQVSEQQSITLSPQGGTNYGAAFRHLAATIKADRDRLRAQDYRIFRPAAFFLTDGAPTDSGWRETFKRELTYDKETGQGFKAHPIFVPFGFRDAPAPVMKKLAYPPSKARWYFARTSSVEDALTGILDVIMKSVITSSMTAHGPKQQLQLPAPANPDLTSGESDDDDFI